MTMKTSLGMHRQDRPNLRTAFESADVAVHRLEWPLANDRAIIRAFLALFACFALNLSVHTDRVEQFAIADPHHEGRKGREGVAVPTAEWVTSSSISVFATVTHSQTLQRFCS